MCTFLIILASIIGWTLSTNLLFSYIYSDSFKIRSVLRTLDIEYDYFDSTIYPESKGLYIQDKRFKNITLYFDKKGKSIIKK